MTPVQNNTTVLEASVDARLSPSGSLKKSNAISQSQVYEGIAISSRVAKSWIRSLDQFSASACEGPDRLGCTRYLQVRAMIALVIASRIHNQSRMVTSIDYILLCAMSTHTSITEYETAQANGPTHCIVSAAWLKQATQTFHPAKTLRRCE